MSESEYHEGSPAGSSDASAATNSTPPVAGATGDHVTSTAAITRRLYRDIAFWGMVVTQFLGAFNDNLFKQLMLLLAIQPATATSAGQDQQGLATMVFSLPFVIGSGFAGYLSDRFSKRRIIILSKFAEILAMLLGMAAFLSFRWTGFNGLLVVLFLMGLQSTFFGPGKYGILPELFRSSDLPRANGVMLMMTFLAIIFGTASAGGVKVALGTSDLSPELAAQRLWVGSAFCVLIAVVGTWTSFWIRPTPPAQPSLQLRDPTALLVPRETRALLWLDRPLLGALIASCGFWLVAGIAIQAVNSLGKDQLRLDELITSLMASAIGLGISGGSVVAGRLSRGEPSRGLLQLGSWAIVVLCFLLFFAPSREQLDLWGPPWDTWGLVPVFLNLVLIGGAAALYAIPLQVFIQDRPPAQQKGRMIATMNVANFVAIMLSGFLYSVADDVIRDYSWPRSSVFMMMALLMLPVALLYRPDFKAPKPDLSGIA